MSNGNLQPNQHGFAPQGYAAPPARTNQLAIASFVLAFVVTLLSIIFGHVALNQIKRTGEGGRGLALAGLWISYLSVVAALTAVGVIWVTALNAQHAASTSFGSGGAVYAAPTPYYNSTPQPYYSAPADSSQPIYGSDATYAVPQYSTASAAVGPAGVAQPASSSPVSDADRAYCQNRGVLLWLAGSATYRGALCSIDGFPTLISMANDVGGNVTLPARSDASSFSATAPDGTEYSYGQGTVTITTASKTFTEPTTEWEAGNASSLSSPGDLDISTPISYPVCDDSVMIVYGTSWNSATNADAVQNLLDAHPGSSYMRTDLSCRAFTGPSTASSEGAYVYAVYSVESGQEAACKAISGTPYYGRVLSNSRNSGDNKLQCG
ncbi:DUF4190 domain-containing protein [Arthrobacter globiformis]|uniref:DUF4190 domain-containing protein n=1 Tax=Arthrobacter globiformis TaxID=1665 RepID=UPI00277DC3EB|nr:DUF4190 domain-containing protein [Arthrobacter globiformis]MDQ0864860.1 hypothetical protein [Arthrobacter globiformis]